MITLSNNKTYDLDATVTQWTHVVLKYHQCVEVRDSFNADVTRTSPSATPDATRGRDKEAQGSGGDRGQESVEITSCLVSVGEKEITTMDYRQMEKLVPCPYNSSHQIIPHRLAKHIVKCKKNYPNADMKVCLFNAVHVVPSHQYQAHLLECDSRGLVERELYFKPNVASSVPEVKPESILVQKTTTNTEDWETECVQSSYSPEEQSLYKEFVRRTPAGMSKGARKAWRLSEIQRVHRLKNGLIGSDSPSDTNTSVPEITRPSASSGAIPKYQDRSKLESTRVIGQTDQKDLSSGTATAFTSALKMPNDSDKCQGPKDMSKMTNFIKEKRKLEKKLIEIKKLESMKADSIEKLTDQEEAKILLKKSIEEKLANLMANVNM